MAEPIKGLRAITRRDSTRLLGKSNTVRRAAAAGVLLVASMLSLPVQAAPTPDIGAGGEHLVNVAGGVRSAASGTEAVAAFECPRINANGASGRRSEGADIAGSLKNAEPTEVNERVGEIVAKMRAQKTDPDVIVDTLVAAYCPLVASERDLTAAEKSARIVPHGVV